MSRIRILLIGVSGMLNEIVSAAIASEPDMTVVDSLARRDEGLGAFTRQRHIDVVIYPAADGGFDDETILGLLKANPRLSAACARRRARRRHAASPGSCA